MSYPQKLAEIVSFFESLSTGERRENLIAFADTAPACEPGEGERFSFQDVRKDAECTDTVGVFLLAGRDGTVRFRISLGPEVQTLTRAMAAILCKGFEGASIQEVLETPGDFVPKIVGADLVRLRSQTVYYVLDRMKRTCEEYSRRSPSSGGEGVSGSR